ncbi:CAP domain-containing protein [Jeotgalibacillus proteolyticus]|nr:CAP-associated domain-containing protein [Jeotgalibacillus proteolyticus]
MKAFMRIMVVIIIIFLIGFYNTPTVQENELVQNEVADRLREETAQPLPPAMSDSLTRPKSGVSIFIGQPTEQLTAQWGEPDRVDAGYYGLEWFIYNRGNEGYFQVAVKEEEVKSIFILGDAIDVSPFYIGQPLEEIYRFTMINSEIVVENEKGTYQFELNEEDLNTRLLVPFGDIFAQIFIDRVDGTVFGIYFLDKDSLIEQRPYELVYQGDIPKTPIEQENQLEINQAVEQQIFDMTNIIRLKNGRDEVVWESEVAEIARYHSQSLYEEDLFTGENAGGTLAERLTVASLEYEEASENIAMNYTHSFAVIHAWLNSQEHRETILKPHFTHLGVGVYYLYFTQDFIKREEEENSNENASIKE